MKTFTNGNPAAPAPTPGTILDADYMDTLEDVRMLFEGPPGTHPIVNALRLNGGARNSATLIGAINHVLVMLDDNDGPMSLLVAAGEWQISEPVDFSGGKIVPVFAAGAMLVKSGDGGAVIMPRNYLALGKSDVFDSAEGFVSFPAGGQVVNLPDETAARIAADTALGNAISDEATTRGNADTALGNAVDGINNRITDGTQDIHVKDVAAEGKLTGQMGGTNQKFKAGGAYAPVLDTASTSGTGEDDMLSRTIPAGALTADGDCLKIVAGGTMSGTATGTRTIRLKLGGTTIATLLLSADTGTIDTASRWMMTAYIWLSGSNIEVLSELTSNMRTTTGTQSITPGSSDFVQAAKNFAAPQALLVTGQCSTSLSLTQRALAVFYEPTQPA